MDINKLSDLSEWDDDEEEEGEEWKPNATRDAYKTLYEQWQQVMVVLNGAMDTMKQTQAKTVFLQITGKIIKE